MHTYTHDRVHVSKILKIKAFACNYIVCSCQAAMPCNRVNMEVCAVELNRRSVDERMSEYNNTWRRVTRIQPIQSRKVMLKSIEDVSDRLECSIKW